MAKYIFGAPLPIVPLYIPMERKAAWSGKWSANVSTEDTRRLGGPWDTEQEVVDAFIATGLYTLRPGTKTPHLDRIEQRRK